MGDPSRYPDSKDDAGSESGGPPTGPPRWVTVLAIVIGIALLALIIVLHLTGVIGPGFH